RRRGRRGRRALEGPAAPASAQAARLPDGRRAVHPRRRRVPLRGGDGSERGHVRRLRRLDRLRREMTAGAATRREGVETDVRARASRLPRSPIFYGIAVAAVAAIAGEWLDVSPPAAYGLCSACHGRDLADWVLNHTEGTKLFVAQAGTSWPLLTVVGVVIGSLVAAKRNGEFGTINLGGNLRQFLYGAGAMCAALFVGGCPTR